MPSFDVVNRLDYQEIDNAIGNASREIENRYDFKGSNATIDRKDNELIAITEDELKLKQVHDLIITHLVRRKVDPLCLVKEKKEKLQSAYVTTLQQIEEKVMEIIEVISKNNNYNMEDNCLLLG